MRAVMGRPFVDATGGSLQALPFIPELEAASSSSAPSWKGDSSAETQTSTAGNATTDRGLGEEWTRRALAEHASVASFSAFSVALMSNGAPAGLVADALGAGLDEVRHARASFDVASRLTGGEVGPGPLPGSRLEFGRDLRALALAVAREGCVDETLSAFAAAAEVKHIGEVLDGKVRDTPYANIDRGLLAFIRDELVTIAMDESNHSALAWRTLNWACSVDSNVCDDVHNDIFDEKILEKRLNQRAHDSFGEMPWALHHMRKEWKKIFKAHQLFITGLESSSICENERSREDHSGQPLLLTVTENIIQQVLDGWGN